MVIAEYVPVSFQPDMDYAIAQVESDSSLLKGTIREVCYIKKIERRAQGQKTAHVILGLALPKQANIAIRQGLIIEGKKVQVRRHKMDPKWCMKCQGVGVNHMVATCKSIHNVCARCAGMHRTDQCGVGMLEDFKCANCNARGHGAADRECPFFKARLAELHAKIPNYDHTRRGHRMPREQMTPGQAVRMGVRCNVETTGGQNARREDTGSMDKGAVHKGGADQGQGRCRWTSCGHV
jgi:hypothetical protein